MSGNFNLADYVDVAARIREFAAKFPEGSLQSEVSFVDGGVLCKAYAYRTAADERPGVGHAFEPVPGKTPYTRDSEVMNAETSAWGRAIVALGFETKKIASADEVRNRSSQEIPADSHGNVPHPDFITPAEIAHASQLASNPPNDDPFNELVSFGKHEGKTVGELPAGYQRWLAGDEFDPKTADGHRVKAAARAVLGREFIGAGVGDDSGIPF